jgi:hypothetical protein
MSLFEDTNPRPLKELLADINSGTTVLPDFQRDFVWDPSATQELVVSIASNFPAGSILRVRDRQGYFAAREFAGSPKMNGRKHTFLVLDGQQRLTSLYQAFYGVGEHRYFVDLRRLMDGSDFEDAIFHERARAKRARELESFAAQASELTLPLSCLKGGTGASLGWILQVTNPMAADERAALLDKLAQINEKFLKVIDDYQFPVVTLSDTTEADALCTIFETLNRTGIKLGVFELLTARFWPQNVNLRALWAAAKEQEPIIAAFEVDPYYLLQAVALLSRPSPSCKHGDILRLDAEDITRWWQPAVDGLALGLHILRDDCGVALPKWLPYSPMLVPLTGVLAKLGAVVSAEQGARRAKLQRWLWCAVFGQAYENSANSQSAKDFTELLKWMEGGPAPDVVAHFRFDPAVLRHVTPRQRSIYRGTMCLVLRQGALDFFSLAPITADLMEQEGIDDHHVFPKHFLKETMGITKKALRDCVLNRTLIDRETNRRIGARAPSDYMVELRETAGFPLTKVLVSHGLPAGPQSPFWTDDFERFLDERQAVLWGAIKDATGATAASRLEAGEPA